MKLLLAIFAIILLAHSSLTLSGTAATTFYESYPRCCCGQGKLYVPKGPNCNPNAKDNLEECTENSGCEYQGNFAALQSKTNYDGHMSLDYVKTTNMVSFYNSDDKNGSQFKSRYGKKTISIKAGNVSFTALISDTCKDSDCGGCCTRNANRQGTNYLVDIEYHTAQRYFGSYKNIPAKVSFTLN